MRICLAFITIALCVGCAETGREEPTPVTYRLKWLYNASVAGSLYAQAQDLFLKEGLQVTIKEGGPERDAIKELELGHAQFGVASADQVIRALSKGSPVVVVAQLFQQNPMQWIYRPSRTVIHDIQDVQGKTIGVTFGGNDETIMRALLTAHHISDDSVTLFSVRYDFTPFYNGKVDLWPVYQNTQGVVIGKKMKDAGETIHFLNPAMFGVRFVANSIVTTKTTLQKKPGLVKKFTMALMEGWRQALDIKNREKAVAVLCQFDKNTPGDIIEKQLSATKMLIQPSDGTAIGRIDRAAWEQTERIMLGQGLISDPVHVGRYLRTPLKKGYDDGTAQFGIK